MPLDMPWATPLNIPWDMPLDMPRWDMPLAMPLDMPWAMLFDVPIGMPLDMSLDVCSAGEAWSVEEAELEAKATEAMAKRMEERVCVRYALGVLEACVRHVIGTRWACVRGMC